MVDGLSSTQGQKGQSNECSGVTYHHRSSGKVPFDKMLAFMEELYVRTFREMDFGE